MLDCLFIGSTTKDILLMVDRPPASDHRLAARSAACACGGIASVAASAFQKLGGRTGLITAVGGPSDVTDFIEADITARNLPYSKILKIPGADSPFSSILVEPDGKRCITCFGGCSRLLTMDMLDLQVLQDAAIIHLGGLEDFFLAELARYCREHTKALISVDGGNISREAVDALLPYVDVFIPDDKSASMTLGLSPEDACRYYADRGVRISCVTLGGAGSVACQDGKFFRAPQVPVSAVDTTGAGDNFHGAFLYCLTQGWDLEKTLRFSNTFAGLTCRGLGGIAAEPSLEETLAKMEACFPGAL